MYKVIIVDDDEVMCEGLKNNIPWEENGIQVVDTAFNGEEGLKLVERHKPHIVLSDITMPRMNGLQMADCIRQSFPWIKVVFLTGYDDFQYAKKALDLKASEYLLKYEEDEVILEAVVKVCKELEEERSLLDRVEKSKPLMKDKFFNELTTGIGSDELIEKEARLLEINFSGRYFCMAVIHVAERKDLSGADKSQGLELQLYSIRNLCEETVEEFGEGIHLVSYYNGVCILFNLRDDSHPTRDYLNRVLGKVLENVKKYLKIAIAIGVGGIYEGYKNISRSYSDAAAALETGSILQQEGILFNREVNNNEDPQEAMVKRIIDYVNKNYHKEELSLGDIANEVYISPAYISTLFKKHMKIYFSDYLAQIRIKKAAELLERTGMKTYEVAEKVGYTNSQYFSTLFKKLTGYSPTDYKVSKIKQS